MTIILAYYLNKNTTQIKHYFHIIVVPVLGFLSVRKTISYDSNRFVLNESFVSWLIIMMLGSFSST
jgi:hypothetical protein